MWSRRAAVEDGGVDRFHSHDLDLGFALLEDLPDTGDPFGFRSGLNLGWNVSHTDLTRDRGINADQLLDTLCHFHSGGVWEVALPNGSYSVLASISGAMNAELHILMACVTLSLLPIFLLYLLGQRFFVEGVAMTGVKG